MLNQGFFDKSIVVDIWWPLHHHVHLRILVMIVVWPLTSSHWQIILLHHHHLLLGIHLVLLLVMTPRLVALPRVVTSHSCSHELLSRWARMLLVLMRSVHTYLSLRATGHGHSRVNLLLHLLLWMINQRLCMCLTGGGHHLRVVLGWHSTLIKCSISSWYMLLLLLLRVLRHSHASAIWTPIINH